MKRIRVVKVGGSLFSLPGFLSALEEWLIHQPKRHTVLIAGGGEFADRIRQLDQRGGVSVESAHGLAIRAMSLLAWTLSQTQPTWCYLDRWQQLRATIAGPAPARTIVFDSAEFLRADEPHCGGTRLPVGWHVTSDSIAARLADALGANELVLLKSAHTTAQNAEQASHEGYVDPFFPQAIGGRQIVRCVDLPGHRQTVWFGRPRNPSTTTNGRPGAASRDARRQHGV